MNVKLLGAASLAAIALVACTKKEAEAPAADATVAEATADPAAEAVEPTADVETTDVYAAPAAFDIGALRTKDALTSATDAVFAKADADASGALSNAEFYSLAAMVQPTVDAVETTVEAGVEAVTDAGAEAAGAVAGEVAGADVAAAVDGALGAEPAATDNAALDASFATLAGEDASLSADEVKNAFLASFDAADVNADGALDDAEVVAFKTAKLF